jgi:hypothetical protein
VETSRHFSPNIYCGSLQVAVFIWTVDGKFRRMTLSYQSVIDPALTRDVDHALVFSLGLRAVF